MLDKERIRAEVMNLGFSLVGFTTPEPLPSFPIFEQWVKNDFFGEMTYLARADTIAKRSNPRLLMPEVKTIIVLAASYPPPIQEVINDRNIPGVAAYARLQSDYHSIFQSSCAEVITLLDNMV